MGSSVMTLIDAAGVRNEPKGFQLGHVTDNDAKTGVTVIYFPEGAMCGCDISGGGPASRETPLASPLTAADSIDAIVLSGGSAYGLAASNGVMKYLEEQGIGFDTGYAKVPLVMQSCIYDLSYGSSKVRPDEEMGCKAAAEALKNKSLKMLSPLMGNVGAGTGATVGKIGGMKRASKCGLGISSLKVGELEVTAIVAVNAAGDIIDPSCGIEIAGFRSEDRTEFMSSVDKIYELASTPKATLNTTIGAVITNADFTKGEANKLASMTRTAYARCIYPVGTMMDGDSIYAACLGKVKADLNTVGTLASEAMAKAIINAVKTSEVSEEEYLKNVQ